MRKLFLGLLVEVGDGDSSSEDSIVGVFSREVCGSLGSEVLQANE